MFYVPKKHSFILEKRKKSKDVRQINAAETRKAIMTRKIVTPKIVFTALQQQSHVVKSCITTLRTSKNLFR